MATDVAAIRVKLQQERQILAEMVALIDLAQEQAALDQAQATYDAARQVFAKKTERWTLVNDKIQRLAVLDAQIALFAP